jgi:8-oxo-dGTP pyrophosphatase MutT (NUDIX family)
MAFERTAGERVYEGTLFTVRRDEFRHDDGGEVTREIVDHPGAVVVLAVDEENERFYMVEQPREAVGEPTLLELPAGKLDTEGEDELDTAKRELGEEIGKGADDWKHLTSFFTSPGFTDEEVHAYLATGLKDVSAETAEEERIAVKEIPLGELDDVIERCQDAKSLVALLWYRAYRRDES